MEFEELKQGELGRTFDLGPLRSCCKAIYGGVAWPGKREGFGVVIAMNHVYAPGAYEVCLLDEFESFDLRELVRQCGTRDFKYMPDKWIGDWQHGAANRFISELNESRQRREHRVFSPIEPWELLEMRPLYPYILGEVKRFLTPDRRQLFLPDDSNAFAYLGGIQPDEVAELELGAYPAIEALAFAVVEMLRDEKDVIVPEPIRSPYDNNILTRGLRRGRRKH
ncbi:MAG: hypothetical protein ACYSWO_05880 [Planctomycetota bacterium]|jgi:hypothetical protein